MTLGEAIKHAEEVAESKRKQVENGDWEKGSLTERDCLECAAEHRQLAEWLKDYKRLKEQEPRKGHWIKGYTFPDGAYWKCDKCNELIKVKFPMNYCNNCGADMRGDEI